MALSQDTMDYLLAHQQEAYDLLLTLAKIPAPSFREEKRAAFCKEWLEKQGARGVYTDEAGNVIYPVGCTDHNPLVVFSAHMDVVFPDETELPMEISDGRIFCPGVGDDSAGLTALLMAAKYVTEKGLVPGDTGILFVANVCEEGLGDLKGMRQLFKDYGSRITALVSFDAKNGRIANRAVGSKRYQVEITTEGGHSYTDFGNRNAIACMASLIDSLYAMKVPEEGKTTFNVGVISGGSTVNSIAQYASMLYEFRSDVQTSLEKMEQHFRAAIDYYRAKGIGIQVTLLGDRPGMGDVDPRKQEELAQRAGQAVREYYHQEPVYGASSFDGNIPLSLGIPAIAAPCYTGGGTHTREEWIYIDSLFPGLQLVFDMILERIHEGEI